MPTYEYACQSCGQHVEVVQRFTDAPLTVCGVCGGPLRKVFHPAGVVFKGSGFYSTDSRSSSRGEKTRSGDSAGRDSGGNGSGAGEGPPSKREGTEARAGSRSGGSGSSSP